MKKGFIFTAIIVSLLMPLISFAFPTVYPTGTTIYKPDKCWSGYTVYKDYVRQSTVLIDMNGNDVKVWEGIGGFPSKVLPGGYLMGSGPAGRRKGAQEEIEVVQVDWDNNIVWRFDRAEQIEDGDKLVWNSRQHHDFQREGNPVGYYSPELAPLVDRGKTLILSHKNVINPKVSPKELSDDYIYEVDWEGNIVWEWLPSDSFDEMGFSDSNIKLIYENPNTTGRSGGDWLHINSLSYVGPNRFYDKGDERFHPENIIWSAREANIIGITNRKGNIVWRVGPDYSEPEFKKIGQIIGQHHAHMIPKGLPGAGNIIVFDNGGAAGYGEPNPMALKGLKTAIRDYSRVIEFDPTTFQIVWEYSAEKAGMEDYKFYSSYISSAQRLPNGNTMITEGADGRMLEVTPDYEIVWEFVNPAFLKMGSTMRNLIYRGYRVPYDWVPQVKKPVEKAVIPPDNSEFRIEPEK